MIRTECCSPPGLNLGCEIGRVGLAFLCFLGLEVGVAFDEALPFRLPPAPDLGCFSV